LRFAAAAIALTSRAARGRYRQHPEHFVWYSHAALQTQRKPFTASELARSFKGAKAEKVQELLEALASLGQARTVENGRFAV